MTANKLVKFINMTDQLVKFKYKSGKFEFFWNSSGKFEFDEKIGDKKLELKMTGWGQIRRSHLRSHI